MWFRICCYVAFVALALSLGASFSHVLELPQKLSLDARDYLSVQSIYRSFGPVGSILEPVVLASLIGILITTPHRTSAIVALTMFALSVILWAIVVNPMNAEMASWHGTLPDSWIEARDQWEWGHVSVFTLKLVAFAALVRIALVRRPDRPCAEAIAPLSPRRDQCNTGAQGTSIAKCTQ